MKPLCPPSIDRTSPAGVAFGIIAGRQGIASVDAYRALRGAARQAFEVAWTEETFAILKQRNAPTAIERQQATRDRLIAIIADGAEHRTDRLAAELGVSPSAIGAHFRYLGVRGYRYTRRYDYETRGNGRWPVAIYRITSAPGASIEGHCGITAARPAHGRRTSAPGRRARGVAA